VAERLSRHMTRRPGMGEVSLMPSGAEEAKSLMKATLWAEARSDDRPRNCGVLITTKGYSVGRI
jgi:hypothetical protein